MFVTNLNSVVKGKVISLPTHNSVKVYVGFYGRVRHFHTPTLHGDLLNVAALIHGTVIDGVDNIAGPNIVPKIV